MRLIPNIGAPGILRNHIALSEYDMTVHSTVIYFWDTTLDAILKQLLTKPQYHPLSSPYCDYKIISPGGLIDALYAYKIWISEVK